MDLDLTANNLKVLICVLMLTYSSGSIQMCPKFGWRFVVEFQLPH